MSAERAPASLLFAMELPEPPVALALSLDENV
jgi:hypothetical protein